MVEATIVRPVEQPPVGELAITTEVDLADYLEATFGLRLPRVRCCAGHCSPWDAFYDAYFARSPVAVWKGSRGFAGKTFTLALLGLVEGVTLSADVSILGGSGEQSQRVLEAMTKLWAAPAAPKHLLASEPAQRHTKFVAGNTIKALMASQASVRGPHPQRLRLDEIDEMKLAILDSAMGQPMSSRGILSQVVMSSTHQYPDGTMTEILKRAKAKGWPVFEWCWRETVEPHGWLSLDEVTRKRASVTEVMWSTEYDLQEPSAEGRAIDPLAVEQMFDRELGELTDVPGQLYQFEPGFGAICGPRDPHASFATGADWGKRRDYSAIPTLRRDRKPWMFVAFYRQRRTAYHLMAEKLNERVKAYGGHALHDNAGVGEAIRDNFTVAVDDYTAWQGKERHALFNEYIAAIEKGDIVSPRLASWYTAHKYVTNDDLFGDGHPPDEFVACALAYRAAKKLKTVRVW